MFGYKKKIVYLHCELNIVVMEKLVLEKFVISVYDRESGDILKTFEIPVYSGNCVAYRNLDGSEFDYDRMRTNLFNYVASSYDILPEQLSEIGYIK